jgi:Do/DeqQ family serine protease
MRLAIVPFAFAGVLALALGARGLELEQPAANAPPASGPPVQTAQFFRTAPSTDNRVVPPNGEVARYSLSPIVKKVAPAVVNVYASRNINPRSSALFQDPVFRQFFGDQQPSRRAQQSLGSGVIVDSAGTIVTNLHVIADADEVKVALADRREFEADIVLKDSQSDLAVLKLKGGGTFPFLELGNSDELEVGDLVLAIGNPFGVGQTVTSGIISALARSQITRDDEKFYIQTDAAINPGNSGGGLIDAAGRLVGINTAIFSPSGGSNGIGFAIPSNMVRLVVDAAHNGGKVRRPWLGASFQTVTAEVANALGIDHSYGALVSDVAADGPAAKAGLRAGDLVTDIDGAAVTDPGMLNYRIVTGGIGRTARLAVLRDGKKMEVRIPLAPAPETVPRDEVRVGGNSPFTGAVIVNLSPAVAEEMGLQSRQTTSGVVVLEAARNTPAGQTGLQRGDIILDVNGTRIDTTRSLDRLVRSTNSRAWRFSIERNGQVIRTQRYGG